jgi:hypothetical protein
LTENSYRSYSNRAQRLFNPITAGKLATKLLRYQYFARKPSMLNILPAPSYPIFPQPLQNKDFGKIDMKKQKYIYICRLQARRKNFDAAC